MGIHSVKLGGIFRQYPAHLFQGHSSLVYPIGVQQGSPGLRSRHSSGNPGKVILSQSLLLCGKAAVVGGNGLNLPRGKPFPEAVAVLLFPERRSAHIFCPLHTGQLIETVVHQQILRAGLHINLLASSPGLQNDVVAFPAGQMDHHHRNIHHFRQSQQTADGLRLRSCGPGGRMAGNAHAACGFGLSLESRNHAAVLAVDAGDAAHLFQPAQDRENGLVVHLGIIGHVQLKGSNPLVHHILDLPADFRVPFRDGHVKPVVAGAFSIRLLMPVGQPLSQGLAGILGAKVYDGGSASPDGGFGAGVKIVRRHRPRHMQVKMGMSVNKSRKQQAAGNVHNLRIRSRQQLHLLRKPYCRYFLSVQDHIGQNGPAARHYNSALQPFFHCSRPPISL